MNITAQFSKDVIEGLEQEPKRLFSKYFYDQKGDRLFQEIMKMEDYYLTKSEFEIFSQQKHKILEAIRPNGKFQLIELGAGDGMKTKVLLEYFIQEKVDFEYIPIDISESVLNELEKDLKSKFPELKVKPLAMTYIDALSELPSDEQKVVLFLGSNIGNFPYDAAANFLTQVSKRLNVGDQLLLGVDLKKHPQIILNAYNDRHGITKAFNLNLLNRINKEFDGNFELSDFEHFPIYDPVSGETKSYLISLKNQEVELKKLNKTFKFKYAEPIFMEISKKYSLEELEKLANASNFKVIEHFLDCKQYFVDSLWQKEIK